MKFPLIHPRVHVSLLGNELTFARMQNRFDLKPPIIERGVFISCSGRSENPTRKTRLSNIVNNM